LNATRAAVEEGVSPGGGVALLRAIKVLSSVKVGNSDQQTGVEIVRKAIRKLQRDKLSIMLAATALLLLVSFLKLPTMALDLTLRKASTAI